jgi:hypothetical protein
MVMRVEGIRRAADTQSVDVTSAVSEVEEVDSVLLFQETNRIGVRMMLVS